MKNLKVGIIGARGLPAQYGAFDQFLDQFVKYSNLKNKNIFFYISAEYGLKKKDINNVSQFYFYRGKSFFILFNNFISILYFYLKGVRTFLFFGYGPVIFFPLLKLLNCKIVCNVDGIEWRRKLGLFKKKYFQFCEKLLSKVKINLIFDSIVIKRYYNIIHKVNGKLLFYPSDFESKTILKKIKFNRNQFKTIIVMRFLPENNIEKIVEAFKILDDLNIRNHKLYIVGKENDYFLNTIQPIIKDYKNIIFLGPIYNRSKLFKFWSCADYYIHGHSVGGTNPTLIEALSLKLPIIAFDCMFNKMILKNNGSYFRTSNDLVSLIKSGNFIHKKRDYDFRFFKRDYINEEYIKLLKN